MKNTLHYDLEDDLNIIPFVFSIFLLIRLISSYIPRISLLAFLILEIAMKMTLNYDLEDDPKIIQFFSFNISLIRLISSYI